MSVPPIEDMEIVLTRDVWSMPRPGTTIEMDNERAEQVIFYFVVLVLFIIFRCKK